MAIRKRRLAKEVVGFVRRAASVAECQRLRAVDLATRDVQAAVRGADLIILCTPLSQMRPLIQQMLPALKRGAIVTDVGSVKASVVRELELLVARSGRSFHRQPSDGRRGEDRASRRRGRICSSARFAW